MRIRTACAISSLAFSLMAVPALSQEAAPGAGRDSYTAAKDGKPASAITRERIAAFAKTLPIGDREDFDLAQRGFIATVADGKLRNSDGQVVGDVNTDAFFSGAAPDTVNPSLWRNAQLLQKHGLFKVTERIYQVRGYSISNMTVIVGDSGYIIVDPGYEAEAYTGMQLVYEHLGKKPITGVIYTHSHTDHYSGVRAVISDEEVAARHVPIVAPEGFIKEILGEAVIAGPAMIRRAAFQFGFGLPVTATGNVADAWTSADHSQSRHKGNRRDADDRRAALRIPDGGQYRGAGRDVLLSARPEGPVSCRGCQRHIA